MLALVWTAVSLIRAHAALPAALYLIVSSFVFVGIGSLAVSAARVDGRGLTWAGIRYVTGYALTAFLVTLMGAARLGAISLWVAAAAAVLGWVIVAREWAGRGERRPSRSLLTGEAFAGTLLLAVVTTGTEYWRTGPRASVFTQYWDLLYHLAMVKDGLYRGIPFHGGALEVGVPRTAYHPAFDTMATVFIGTLHLPVDVAFFRIILPVTLLAMLVALGLVGVAWGRSHTAGALALGMVAFTFGLSYLPGFARSIVGDVGLLPLRYFMNNPPSAVGVVGAMTCLAIVALAVDGGAARRLESSPDRAAAGLTADGRGPRPGPFVLAGILAGATALMKAQIAIVLAPALCITLLYWAWRSGGRGRWISALACVGATAAAGAIAYPTTIGKSAPLAVRPGVLASFLIHWKSYHELIAPLRAIGAPLLRLGAVGGMLFVLAYIVLGLFGWWLVVLLVALRHAHATGARPFGRAPAATHMALIFGGLATLVGLGLAQRNAGSSSTWNISFHTVQNIWWLGLCAAAVALSAAARRPARLTPLRGRRYAIVAVVALVAIAAAGVSASRQTGDGRVPTQLRTILQTWDRYVPRSALLVQDYDLVRNNWVSAIGGRRVVLERGITGADLFPDQTNKLERDITLLYSTPSTARASLLVRETGADFALVDRHGGAAQGLRAIGRVVMQLGPWELLDLKAGPQAQAADQLARAM